MDWLNQNHTRAIDLKLSHNAIKTRQQPEVFYYNLNIVNPNSQNNNIYAPNTASVPCQASARNNIPICDNPSEYYCSINRCQIPLRNAPLIQFLVQTPIPNSGAINNGIYSITMQYCQANGTVIATGSQTFLQYIPRNDYTPPPYVFPAPVQLYTDYYFMYQVQQLLEFQTTAMNAALASLKAQTGTGPIAAATSPAMNYDALTQLITIYSEEAYYDISSGNPYIAVYINKLNEEFFSGFPKITNPLGTGLANGCDLQLVIKSYNGINVAAGIISTIQNYTNYGYWSFIKSIYIGTTMNVNSESFFSNTTIQQVNNSTNNVAQNQTFVNVVYDFLPDLSQLAGELGAATKIQLYDAPTNLYRPFTFNQIEPLYEVNLSVYMVDRFGNVYPLPLGVNETASFKLQFIRKDLVKF